MKHLSIFNISIFCKYILFGLVFTSCNTDFEEIKEPTFTVTYFDKKSNNSVYECNAIINITNIPYEFSIDGILYANEITEIKHDTPNLQLNKYKIADNKYNFNIYGKHKGDIQIELSWISEDNLDSYFVAFHLAYGFGKNCEVQMIDLQY